jgi:hypothetical protein
VAKSPRQWFLCCNDDQQLVARRYDNSWSSGSPVRCASGPNPPSPFAFQKLFNLRTDPYERADITSVAYYDWLVDHVFLLVPAQAFFGAFLATLAEYPQRQKAASFKLDEVLRNMQQAHHK